MAPLEKERFWVTGKSHKESSRSHIPLMNAETVQQNFLGMSHRGVKQMTYVDCIILIRARRGVSLYVLSLPYQGLITSLKCSSGSALTAELVLRLLGFAHNSDDPHRTRGGLSRGRSLRSCAVGDSHTSHWDRDRDRNGHNRWGMCSKHRLDPTRIIKADFMAAIIIIR